MNHKTTTSQYPHQPIGYKEPGRDGGQQEGAWLRSRDQYVHASGTLFHGWVTFIWRGQGKRYKIHTFFSIQFQMFLAHTHLLKHLLIPSCQGPTIYQSVYYYKDASLSSKNEKETWERKSLGKEGPSFSSATHDSYCPLTLHAASESYSTLWAHYQLKRWHLR